MQSFSGLPPALRQKAANLATWFPEVLAISGAPEEENFSGAHLHVSESSTSKTLEVILPKKKQPQKSEALGQGVQERLERLDRLAADFESLTSQLQTLNSAAMRLQREAVEESSMGTRLDAATDELLKLTEILKANPLKAAPQLPNDSPNEGCSLPPAEAESTKAPLQAQAPREARPMLSPRSARGRGGQAQQGGWSQRNLGAGRSRANKAEWKDKLKIEVTKVREMPESDPKSPKGKAPAQVWGTTIPPQPLRRGDTLTPSSMQARIEQKLTMVLGQASRRPERTRTLPASAFPSAFQSQLAELSGKKKPASAEDLSSSSG